MIQTRLARQTCVIALCTLLVACGHMYEPTYSGEEDGIGGTGVIANTDGIGGTGIQGDPDTDGIGGTGLWASAGSSGDVALYGVATSVDTLVVNGHGMFLSETTAFLLNGNPASLAQLMPGQVITVRAGLVDGVITAKSIHADDAVIGPIESIAADGQSLEVLDQQVTINAHGRKDLPSLQIGDVIRVSGLRRLDGSIDTTLVTFARPDTRYLVSGWATPAGRDRHTIGDLDLPSAALHLASGANQRLVIEWQLDAGKRSLESVSPRPALPFSRAVDYWSLQGYAISESPDGAMQFGAYHGPLTNAKQLGFEHGEQRVIVDIRASDTAAPQVSRIVESPSQPPDTDIYLPYYAPKIQYPGLRVAPTLELPTPNTDPTIAVPRAPAPNAQPRVRQPRTPATPASRPVPTVPPVDTTAPSLPPAPSPPSPPKVDIQPVAPQPTIDALPASSVIPSR